jgi:hypothetical protein
LNEINITALQNMSDIQNMVGSANSEDSSLFILSIFFGIIGMIYFSFGKKKDDKDMFMYSGIGLMAFPYLIDGKMETILIGLLLTIIPFFIKR